MIKIAVTGAHQHVGKSILQLLFEEGFSKENIVALSSKQGRGQAVSFGEDDTLSIQSSESFDFKGIEYVLLTEDPLLSKPIAMRAKAAGARVIDGSGAFRSQKDVPMILPGVHESLLKEGKNQIVSIPTSAAVQVATVLAPLHRIAKIKRAIFHVYQSVSHQGQEGMDELFSQARGILMNAQVKPQYFSHPIAFNVVPQVGDLNTQGETEEEENIRKDVQKVMGEKIPCSITCVYVPVFMGDSISMNLEFENPMSVSEAKKALQSFKYNGVPFIRIPKDYATPIEVTGEDTIFVGRIRKDPSVEHGLQLWSVSDNLRRCSALPMIQTLRYLQTLFEA